MLVAAAVLSSLGGSVYIDICFLFAFKKNVPGELLTRFPHVVTLSGMGSRSRKAGND